MTDRIEEVKKILKPLEIFKIDIDIYAQKICQLFEPQPDDGEIDVVECQINNQSFSGKGAGVHTKDTGHNKWELLLPQPDADRLLTEIEVMKTREKWKYDQDHISNYGKIEDRIAKAQDAKTASIYQEKIREIIEEIEEHSQYEYGGLTYEEWQSLKNRFLGEK